MPFKSFFARLAIISFPGSPEILSEINIHFGRNVFGSNLYYSKTFHSITSLHLTWFHNHLRSCLFSYCLQHLSKDWLSVFSIILRICTFSTTRVSYLFCLILSYIFCCAFSLGVWPYNLTLKKNLIFLKAGYFIRS